MTRRKNDAKRQGPMFSLIFFSEAIKQIKQRKEDLSMHNYKIDA